ncbi:DUF3578 domain-containing protein [Cohnella lubricantis]|uniref:DUF3578 domain-containing protein n=1 Tax=Cohnella lubricantis TaxID=2163172 RepID=A0A841TA15_9BACL|nr:DUF3578 domain-containing protein [Cohnella lubricantis]MBB6675877.1 DUF3578 domain-containing protein [Cohnella lubricantis]MBP2117207.1 MoxR-like ATPase [Cohnella lubricantis]
MTLPQTLQGIFKNKQRSYKMVLILSLTEGEKIETIDLDRICERFRQNFLDRESKGLPIDNPPTYLGDSWSSLGSGQLKTIIQNPIQALSDIVEYNPAENSLSFKPDIQRLLTSEVIRELRIYAAQELRAYYLSTSQSSDDLKNFSLRIYFQQVMDGYLQAKKESIKQHPMDHLVRKAIPQELKRLDFISNSPFIVEGSVGKGNWATIPWIAIMDENITNTTQKGQYLVYLFSEDMKALYLSFAQGVTEPLKEGKKKAYSYLGQVVKETRSILPLEGTRKDKDIFLTTNSLGEAYQESTIAYYKYESHNLPTDEQIVADLKNMVDNYRLYAQKVEREDVEPEDQMTVSETIKQVQTYIQSQGFSYPDHLIENFYLSLKTKPFAILAGISGTGKTKLVKLFAEALDATEANGQFALIPVRPDWSDPSDLIGYTDLSNQFRLGPLTKVLLEASKPENHHKPYFICLDEMNLARVEHYFSDILSLLETQEWNGDDIVTNPIVKKEQLVGSNTATDDTEDLRIPDNVFLVGTVNMDETTHPFSKKVLDRANTIEFNYIDLGNFPEALHAEESAERVVGKSSILRSDYLKLQDAYGEYAELIRETTGRLSEINDILEGINSHIGFRVRDAVSFYMIYNERFGLLPKDVAFDHQLMQKILPRIQGSSHSVKQVLVELYLLCLGRPEQNIASLVDDASELYKPWRRGAELPKAKYPESARKLAFMLRRIEEDGFTSFWLS